MQDSKVVDITRSFIPVNPNAFPESMSATGKEDYPENRVPVVPYMGYNFLPTSYGYKSYFGTNEKLLINSLLPNRVDRLFMFQTLTFKNIVVALCDTGIWYKESTVGGAWTQAIVLAVPADDLFSEWTTATIKNVTYAFRANAAAYWKIEVDLSTLVGIKVTPQVPSFITIASQLGLGRLGARLCFWDATNALAWSASDDLNNFTPDVKTGANVTTFTSIQGSISAIRPHGKNAILYASKSVIHLEVSPNETFLIKATPIIGGAGVPYHRQSVTAIPDTTHYCYSESGIWEIKNGVPENVLVSLFDYFKEYTQTPVYLKMLEGRYLVFETTDANALNGSALFSKSVIPPSTITFPAINPDLDTVHNTPTTPICDVLGLFDNGFFDQHKAAALIAVPNNIRAPGSDVKPVYTCYISNHGAKDLSNIDWIAAPCGPVGPNGTTFKMSPNINGTTDTLTTDSTNKTATTGAAAYTDGKWTMSRFVQMQTAIWNAEAKVVKSLVELIKGRAFSETKKTANTTSCAIASPVYSNCNLGRWPTAFSGPQFGYDNCSFWLTRYVTAAEDLTCKYKTTVDCTNISQPLAPSGYWIEGTGGNPSTAVNYGSAAEAAAGFGPGGVFSPNVGGSSTLGGVGTAQGTSLIGFSTFGTGTKYVFAHWDADAGKVVSQTAAGTGGLPPLVSQAYAAGHWDKTEVFGTHNEGVNVPGVTGVETAWCEITGWEYTDVNGNKQTAASSACAPTNADRYPGSTSPGGRVIPANAGQTVPTSNDGSLCGKPFDPNLLNVLWTDQSVTYPGSEFLMQLGTIAPKYPTFAGAFVYDLGLKKWGKIKLDYKQLLDYSPINSVSSNTVNFSTFGIMASVLKADGYLYLFDKNPASSLLTWGKIGYYRAGMTDLQELRIDFKELSTGNLIIDLSMDGATIASDLSTSTVFTSARQVTAYPPYSGKWFNISLTGQYDVVFMEPKGLQKGRR